MKVLHVYEKAGVPGLLAKYFKGVQVVPKGSRRFYPALEIGTRSKNKLILKLYNYLFLLFVAVYSWQFKIIHIHDNHWILALLIPFKKKVFHFHGSDIRPGSKQARYNQFFFKHFNLGPRIIATPDLAKFVKGAFYLPTITDEIFRRPNQGVLCAVYLTKKYETGDYALSLAGVLGVCFWPLQYGKIPYEKMPGILNKYAYFIDQHTFKALSKTALEALKSGCVVFGYDQVYFNLPKKFETRNILARLGKIYRTLS